MLRFEMLDPKAGELRSRHPRKLSEGRQQDTDKDGQDQPRVARVGCRVPCAHLPALAGGTRTGLSAMFSATNCCAVCCLFSVVVGGLLLCRDWSNENVAGPEIFLFGDLGRRS